MHRRPGGGYWRTEIQIEARNTVSTLRFYLFYGNGDYHSVSISVTMSNWDVWKTSNILGTMDAYDPSSFDYYPRVGALGIWTGSTSQKISVNARTYHSNGYSKSFNGIGDIAGQVVVDGHVMAVGALVHNGTNDPSARPAISHAIY